MSNYFCDTCALFEIVEGNPKYAPYFESDAAITFFNLAELVFITLKKKDLVSAEKVYSLFERCVVDVPKEVLFSAMKLKLDLKKRKLSYADCIGYCVALHLKIKFLTSDSEFKNLHNVEFVS